MNEMRPLISVIMPVYNTGAFLDRSISALLKQTLSQIEIICINDGSQDDSLARLKAFANQDSRIVIIDQPNQGPGAARNQGLMKARGKYIMFCDSDDWYAPEMCQEMLHAIEKTGTDAAMCDTHVIDEFPGMKRMDDISCYFLRQKGLIKLNEPRQKRKINVLLWCKIFKKELIDRYHILFPEGLYHEDDAFIFAYMTVAKDIFLLNKKLYYYFRRSQGSVVTDHLSGSKSMDRCQMAHFILSWLEKEGLLLQSASDFLSFYEMELTECYRRLHPDLRPQLFEAEKLFMKDLWNRYPELFEAKQKRATKKRLAFVLAGKRIDFENAIEILSYENLPILRRKLLLKHIAVGITFGLIKGLKKSLRKTKSRIEKFEAAVALK